MGLNMQIWRAGDTLVPLVQGGTPTEKRLEELLETNPTLLGLPLLVIGRQVRTAVDGARIVEGAARDLARRLPRCGGSASDSVDGYYVES